MTEAEGKCLPSQNQERSTRQSNFDERMATFEIEVKDMQHVLNGAAMGRDLSLQLQVCDPRTKIPIKPDPDSLEDLVFLLTKGARGRFMSAEVARERPDEVPD